MFKYFYYLFTGSLIILLTSCNTDTVNRKSNNKTNETIYKYNTPVYYNQDTPESVLKNYFIAIMYNDVEKLKEVIVPHPNYEILLIKHTQPIDTMQERAVFHKHLSEMTTRTLNLGDSLKLPNGKILDIGSSHVNGNSQMLLPSTPATGVSPLPIRIINLNGQWKVDAAPFIAARLTAQASRQELSEDK